VHRLQDKFEVIPSGAGGFKQTGGGGLSGEEQHFAVRAMFPQLNCQVDPGERGHHDIRDEEIGRVLPSGFQRIERPGEGSSVEAALKAQDHRQGRGDDVLIIDNKDAGLSAGLGHDVSLS